MEVAAGMVIAVAVLKVRAPFFQIARHPSPEWARCAELWTQHNASSAPSNLKSFRRAFYCEDSEGSTKVVLGLGNLGWLILSFANQSRWMRRQKTDNLLRNRDVNPASRIRLCRISKECLCASRRRLLFVVGRGATKPGYSLVRRWVNRSDQTGPCAG